MNVTLLLGHIQCELFCEQPFGEITVILNDTSLSAYVDAYICIHFWIRVRLAICFVKSFMFTKSNRSLSRGDHFVLDIGN